MGELKYGKKSVSNNSGNRRITHEVEIPLCKKCRKTYQVTVIYVSKSAEEVKTKRSIIEDVVKRKV